jgi:HSP20 family protein
MNRLFDTFFQGRALGAANGTGAARRWVPPMDLVEAEDEYVLRADLPGLAEDDLDIEVKDNVLTISGERRAEHEDRREGYHRVERAFGRFSRSLDLPEGIDSSAVSADFENGVLEVRIPKPEERQPTKIAIGSRNGNSLEAGEE